MVVGMLLSVALQGAAKFLRYGDDFLRFSCAFVSFEGRGGTPAPSGAPCGPKSRF